MKKILILIVLSLGYLLGYSQFPITQSIGSPKTKVVNKGIFYSDSAIIVTGYTDTTQANLGYIKNIPHVIIATSNDIWIRNIAATAWLQLVNIGSGATDTLAWMLSGNNATGMGGVPVMGTTSYTDFNFATNNLKRFSVSKDGIQDSTVNVLPLGIDTTTGYLSYARAGGGGGGGTDSSIRKGYGIIIDISGTNRTISGDSLQFATRSRLMHVTDSLLTIIGAKPSGSGTTDYLARWTSSNTLGTGATRDDGNSVGIGMAPGGVNGSLSLLANLYLPNSTSTLGSLYKNGSRWLHNSGGTGNNNMYWGFGAGNDSSGAQTFLNVAAGFGALNKVSGFGNIGIGYSAGGSLREWDGSQAGSRNIFIGYEAGLNAIGSSHSVIIGTGAGANLQYGTYSQVLIGKSVGSAITTGTANTFVGSAINVTTGEWNVALGPDALQSGTSASYNMVGGAYAASALTTGYGNVMFGNHAGSAVTTGGNNVLLGQYAGNAVGSGNVMIGGFAAAYESGLNSKLVIDAGLAGPSRHTLNGDFATHQVGIDRTLAELAAASGYKFQVNGNIYGTSNLKLGGITAGAGHKAVRFNTTDSSFYLADTTIGVNLGNSNLTQTGGNRTYTGAGQNLIFNGSGGTSLFNVEYNSIILTAQNSGVNIQGDSILISANVGKVYIDSLPPSIDAIDSVVVITPTGQLKQKAQSDLVGGLLSGTYTPTLTNVANVAASTAYSCQYSRVGTVVTVSGEVDIDPTTTLTLTQLGISLPIASNLTATNELGGTSADDLNTAARVAGDATNNRAEIRMTPVDVTNRRFSFTFTYRVL